jgi:hypothetical protein
VFPSDEQSADRANLSRAPCALVRWSSSSTSGRRALRGTRMPDESSKDNSSAKGTGEIVHAAWKDSAARPPNLRDGVASDAVCASRPASTEG